MSTDDDIVSAGEADVVDRTALGRSVAARFRRPGPPLRRPRPAPIGSLASAATRFVAGMARPPGVRRTLRGPDPNLSLVPAALVGGAAVRPPRWWTPRLDLQPQASGTDVSPRGLPAAAKSGGTSAPPGQMAEAMVAHAVRVPRHPDVAAAGPMLTQRERTAAALARAATPVQGGTGQAASGRTVRRPDRRLPGGDRPPGNASGGAGVRPAPAAGVGATSLDALAWRRFAESAPAATQRATSSSTSSLTAADSADRSAPAAQAVTARRTSPGAAVRQVVGPSAVPRLLPNAAQDVMAANVGLNAVPSTAPLVPNTARFMPNTARHAVPSGGTVALRRAAFGLLAGRSRRAREVARALDEPATTPRAGLPARAAVQRRRPIVPVEVWRSAPASATAAGSGTTPPEVPAASDLSAPLAAEALRGPGLDAMSAPASVPLRRVATAPAQPTPRAGDEPALTSVSPPLPLARATARRSMARPDAAAALPRALGPGRVVRVAGPPGPPAGRVVSPFGFGRVRAGAVRQAVALAAVTPSAATAAVSPAALRAGTGSQAHIAGASAISVADAVSEGRIGGAPVGGYLARAFATKPRLTQAGSYSAQLPVSLARGRSPLVATVSAHTAIRGLTTSGVPATAVRIHDARGAVRPAWLGGVRPLMGGTFAAPLDVVPATAVPAARTVSAASMARNAATAAADRPVRAGAAARRLAAPAIARAKRLPTEPVGAASVIRRLPIAPPRGSGRPVQRAGQAVFPAENRGGMPTATGGGSGGSGGLRRSLVESTAAAFARRAAAEASPVAASAGLAAFAGAAGSWEGAAVVQRVPQIGAHRGRPRSGGATPVPVSAPAGTTESPRSDLSRLPARDFQRLVDSVVEALEQRVVEELERRGRRHPGVF